VQDAVISDGEPAVPIQFEHDARAGLFLGRVFGRIVRLLVAAHVVPIPDVVRQIVVEGRPRPAVGDVARGFHCDALGHQLVEQHAVLEVSLLVEQALHHGAAGREIGLDADELDASVTQSYALARQLVPDGKFCDVTLPLEGIERGRLHAMVGVDRECLRHVRLDLAFAPGLADRWREPAECKMLAHGALGEPE